mgnify:CR=1 FL=1
MSSNQYAIAGTGIHPLSVGGSSGTFNITGAKNAIATSKSMELRITPANNGTIVSIRTGDYSEPDLYVIHDDQELGQEIGKIITMTILKKE